MHEPAQQALLIGDPPHVADGRVCKLVRVVRGVVGERPALEIAPHILDGVQLRCVGPRDLRLFEQGPGTNPSFHRRTPADARRVKNTRICMAVYSLAPEC